ncbi:MBL fold metallo-hydrolase [Clostridium sp. BJN0013]|uniref:MBL fold metallo-hydrolase n=1 Tax=Clostridium sp. BJN0013 TaxID=3236840 RepID=UPI0034C68710
MLLNFLGRGSAFNTKEGNNSAFVKIKNELILLDCGENIFERIINRKILKNVSDIHVLITHMDSDHIGSLSSLIYYCYYIKHIVVEVSFPTRELYDFLKLQGHIENQNYKFNLIGTDINNTLNFINVKPIKVNHIKTLNCYGYLIYIKDKLIWYSGDCSNVSNVINEYVIEEFYQDTCLAEYKGNVHTSLKLLCKSISKDKRNKVYCMHIDCDELIEKAKYEGFNVVEVNSN